MGKHSRHAEHAQAARQLLRDAKTAYEIRLAQSLLLPLELGLTLEQTAQAIGRCPGAISVMRSSFDKKLAKLAAAQRRQVGPTTDTNQPSPSPAPLHSRNHA